MYMKNVPSRAYIAVKTQEQQASFSREYDHDGHIFIDKTGAMLCFLHGQLRILILFRRRISGCSRVLQETILMSMLFACPLRPHQISYTENQAVEHLHIRTKYLSYQYTASRRYTKAVQ